MPYAWDELAAAILRERERRPEAAIWLAIDEGAPWSDVSRLVGILRDADVRDLRILGEPDGSAAAADGAPLP